MSSEKLVFVLFLSNVLLLTVCAYSEVDTLMPKLPGDYYPYDPSQKYELMSALKKKDKSNCFVDIEPPQEKRYPTSCANVTERSNQCTGVRTIQPTSAVRPFDVLCVKQFLGGGWTTVLSRHDGSQPFDLSYAEYQTGFGDPRWNYFIGLDNLHALTGSRPTELLVNLYDWVGNHAYAHYKRFSIGSQLTGYTLNVIDGFSGNTTDALGFSKGMKWSTADRDRDDSPLNCAKDYGKGGWWYKNCMKSQLTGLYLHGLLPPSQTAHGIYWDKFQDYNYSLKEVQMLIR